MPYVTIEESGWVDLDDFNTEDLVEELKSRKESMPAHVDSANAVDLVNEIYLAKHVRGQPYDQLVNQLIYSVLGKTV
jgi:hypothetical protein